MAAKQLSRPIGQLLRTAERSNVSLSALRTFATTTSRPKELAAESSSFPNMRHAQRGEQKTLNVPIVNPADKYADKATELHQYGQYLLSCLPRYVQQYVH
jgi:NADH dehydrogenase (ubiquinone) Fe-S protein 3